MTIKKTCITGLLAFGLGAVSQAAILVDDVLLINFNQTGNSVGGNWNNILADGNNRWGPTNATDYELDADLIRFSDGGSTNVGLDVTYTSSGSGIGGYDNASALGFSFPESGSVPTVADQNLSYNNAGTTYSLTGLDDSLTYNISILASHVGGDNINENNWVINGTNLSVDPDGSDGSGVGGVFTLSGVATDGSGNIEFVHSGNTTPGFNNQPINAMEIVAIPEPGTLALVGLTLGALLVFRRRR